ncbi:DUF6350 family protein [Nocardia sp. NBC_01503]|uniref:cell division protein PerM n=1 Tax=Nocardia sp. NBC_01503 TaxID=2975997 RepID=UPI002E7B450D|nr:DUF6350 family protein [Nocardia sp. NBC_01503]WTL35468.1 DUF6350 family protein [Nocardia sp. NBC_01503]
MTDEDVRERPRGPVSVGGGGFGSLTPEWARVLFFVAARASAIVLLIIFAVVFGTLLAAGSGLSGASGAISASWLAVHQVPLTIGRTSIGLWPLLPTGLMLWLVARDCARAADHCAAEGDCTPVDLAWIAGAATGGPLLVTAVCLAVADDASAVVALQPPNTLVAFAWVIGLHLLAVIAGVGVRHWRDFTDLLPIPLPHWVVPGMRAGMRSVWRLLGVAAVLTVVSFVVHWSRIGDTYHSAGNFAGALGLTLLSLAYLPNALIDAVSVLLGGQVRIGAGSLSLFGIDGAPVPAVPVLAAVPSGPVAAWWLVFLIAPAAVGVLGGLDCGRGTDDRPTAPWATLTAAASAAVLIALLGAVAGGELGTFGWIGPDALIAAVLAFLWFAATGYVGMLGARWFAPVEVPAAEYDYDDNEYDTEYEDDGYDGEYAEDDYYEDDEYDDYYDDDDPGHVVEVDGELLDEPDALDHEPHAESAENSDIVDAEVVEGDLPDNPEVDGR